MALTAVEDLYNLALGLIDEHGITEGRTSEKQYVLCDRFYAKARDEALISHPWNEAITDDIILQETTAPLILHNYKYEVPSDCLRVLSIGSDLYHWERKGNYIVTDYARAPDVWITATDYVAGQYVRSPDESVTYLCATSHTSDTWAGDAAYWTTQSGDYYVIDVEYIKQLTDTTLWSPILEEAVVHKLAIKVAPSITGGQEVKKALVEEYNKVILPQARSIDAVEGRLKPLFQSRWIRARSQS